MWSAAATPDLRHAALILAFVLAACGNAAPADTTTASTTPPTTSLPAPTTSTTIGATTTSQAATTTTVPPTTTTTDAPTTTAPSGFDYSVSAVSRQRLGHSWHQGCPVHWSDLSMVTLDYWGFDGREHAGEIVVAAGQAEAVASVFGELYEAHFPIVSIIPIGDLPKGAEDEPDYDNTSGFHCRFVAGTSTWSQHANGLAIDLNVMQNPFIDGNVIWPENSGLYLDRSLDKPGMIHAGDEVVDAFASIGWGWGGYWNSLKDYQHFSATGT
jgi:hypothetical protein